MSLCTLSVASFGLVENLRRRKREEGDSDEVTEDELLAARLEAERLAAEQAEAERLEREEVGCSFGLSSNYNISGLFVLLQIQRKI